MSDPFLDQYSRDEIVQMLLKIKAEYPHTYRWFFEEELRQQSATSNEQDSRERHPGLD
jgi:hypothetical protein